jgi:hypothetical protein
MTVRSIRSVAGGFALAYCHLPFVFAAVLFEGANKWQLLVGAIPWVGMALPCLFFAILISFLIVPGVAEGHPPAALTGDAGLLFLGGLTLALFLLVYGGLLFGWLARSRWARRACGVFLVLWTVLGDSGAVIFLPRVEARALAGLREPLTQRSSVRGPEPRAAKLLRSAAT